MSALEGPDADESLERFVAKIARSWLWFLGLWLGAAHELGRLAIASSPLLPKATLGAALGEVAVLAVVVGLWLRRHGGLGVGRSATALRAAAIGVALSPLVIRAALSGGATELMAVHAWLPAMAALLVVCLLVAWWDFGEASLTLGVVTVWLKPGTIFAGLVLFGAAAFALGRVGFEKTLPLIGLAMVATARGSERLATELYGRAIGTWGWERRFAVLEVLACVGLFAFSPATSARGLRRSLEATPVFAMSDAYHRLEVTTAQGQSQWFIDGELQLSSMDHPRYYETLVHPALLRAPRLTRVVAFSAGLGLLEREILRYPEVARLEVVTDTTLGPRAYRELAWLASASGHALDDERLVVTPGEASAWLEASGPKFDAAIIDLPDPTSYYWGKYFTRFFFRMLEARLAPDGVIAMQVTSSEHAATILWKSAEAAGYAGKLLYAPVPTMGEWHVLVASRQHLGAPLRPLPRGLRFLTSAMLPGLELAPSNALALVDVPLSLLHDQTAFDTVVEEAKERRQRR